MAISRDNLSFEPGLNLLRVSQRKIKKILGRLIFIFLIGVGLYGVLVSVSHPWQEYRTLFYFSLLTDMFLFYLWRQKKSYRPIRPPKEGEKLEVSVFLDEKSRQLLEDAYRLARRSRYRFLRPIHFFAVCLKEKKFRKIIKRLDCSVEQVTEKTESILEKSLSEESGEVFGPDLSADFKKIFCDAYVFCLRRGYSQIGPLDILWAISQQKNMVGMVFDEFGISPSEIEKVIEWARLEGEIRRSEKNFFWRRLFKPAGKLNRAMTAVLTPTLDKVSQDLTLLAKRGEFEMVIGREKELEQIFNFFNAGRVGAVLVGEDEVGKKSIVKKLAQLMTEENVPNFLKDKRLIELDLGALVSLGGSQKIEEYLRQVVYEVNWAGNIVLVMKDIDNLAGLKSQASGLDLSEIMVSALEIKAFFLLGTSLPANYASKIEGKILGRVLDKIEIETPARDFLWKILIAKIYLIEKKLKVFFSADALDQAIDLADRYIYGKSLPAKTIDLLTEVGYLISGRKDSDGVINGDDVVELVSKKTKVPLKDTEETEKRKLLDLEKLIHQRLVNQEEAVKAVAAAMRRSRLEVKKRDKPIANFLFVGPTGVGKTELAKTLARVYFGDEKRMLRLDMSEYQEKRGIRRLIGLRTDEGTEKGYLTEAVKRQPYSLLLLDELEKAHPDILNLFLQVMDDGRLTGADNETINFTNIILIATSNAGTNFIQNKIKDGISYEEIDRELKDEVLLEYFRPEFLNRFDKIVLFTALSFENIREITRLFIKEINGGLEERAVTLEAENEAIDELAALGYNPLYGARPLRRAIQEKVEDVVARMFLEDKVKRRDKIIVKKGLVFEIKKGKEF